MVISFHWEQHYTDPTSGATGIWKHITGLASFPGRSHLQYLIAYSMQIRRGKAWEIWSCVVMSGKQRVDTWAMNLEVFSCTISVSVGGQSISKAASILFVIHGTRDESTQSRNCYCRATAPVFTLCPPDVTKYCKRSNIGEQGYIQEVVLWSSYARWY